MPATKANREKGRKGRRRLWLPAPFFFRPFSPRTGAGAMVLHMQLPWRWFAPGPAPCRADVWFEEVPFAGSG